MVRKMSAFKKGTEIQINCREPPLTGIEKRVQLIFVQAGTAASGYRQKAPGDSDTDPWYGSDITFCQDGESLFRTEKHFCRIRSGGYFQAVCWQAYKKNLQHEVRPADENHQ